MLVNRLLQACCLISLIGISSVAAGHTTQVPTTFGGSRSGLDQFGFLRVFWRFEIRKFIFQLQHYKDQPNKGHIKPPSWYTAHPPAGHPSGGQSSGGGSSTHTGSNTGSPSATASGSGGTSPTGTGTGTGSGTIISPTVSGSNTGSSTGNTTATGTGSTSLGSTQTPTGTPTGSPSGESSSGSSTTSTSTSVKPSVTAGTPIAGVPALSTTCPKGFEYNTWTDDFKTFDDDKWDWQDGPESNTKFGADGVVMTVNRTAYNVAYQSTPQWVSPVQMSVSVKSSEAPGIVSSVAFRSGCEEGTLACSDEIDLELIAKTYQLPLWQFSGDKVQKLDIPRDTSDAPGAGFTKRQDWVYLGNGVPYDKVHEWVVNWDVDQISWFMDKKPVVDFKKAANAKYWPQQSLHVRYGVWGVTQSDWAEGSVDWQKYPEPQQQMTQITVTGCMKMS